jgi:DUF4097 and DUF4098 domain-containing protein YvlB
MTRLVHLASLGLVAMVMPLRNLPAQQTVDHGVAVAQDLRIKIWVPAGTVRLTGWDADSLHVRGTVTGGTIYHGGARGAWKLNVESASESMAPAEVDIRLPRGAQVSVKTVTGSIVATDVAGWFNSVSGDVVLDGRARRVEAETLDGDIAINGQMPWVSARTGSGTIKIEGLFEDVRASSVSGGISILNKRVSRGRFESVSGDIRYRGAFADPAAIEFDSHGGDVTLVLPTDVVGAFQFTSITGTIDNQFSDLAPQARLEGVGQDLSFRAGTSATTITARTFKGSIKLRVAR